MDSVPIFGLGLQFLNDSTKDNRNTIGIAVVQLIYFLTVIS